MKTVKQLLVLIVLVSLVVGNAAFAFAAPGDQKVFYYLHDHLGGIQAVTDEQGNVVEWRDYLPYGEDRLADDDPATDYGFTGKEQDPETELYYYGARYYDPMLGRFISVEIFSDEAKKNSRFDRIINEIKGDFKNETGLNLDIAAYKWEDVGPGTKFQKSDLIDIK